MHLHNGKPFYVGCSSTEKRAYSSAGRSSDWTLIAENGYDVVIVNKELSMFDAYLAEAMLIDKHRNAIVNSQCGCFAQSLRIASFSVTKALNAEKIRLQKVKFPKQPNLRVVGVIPGYVILKNGTKRQPFLRTIADVGSLFSMGIKIVPKMASNH